MEKKKEYRERHAWQAGSGGSFREKEEENIPQRWRQTKSLGEPSSAAILSTVATLAQPQTQPGPRPLTHVPSSGSFMDGSGSFQASAAAGSGALSFGAQGVRTAWQHPREVEMPSSRVDQGMTGVLWGFDGRSSSSELAPGSGHLPLEGHGSGVWAPAGVVLNPVEDYQGRGPGSFTGSAEGSGRLDARFVVRSWRRGPPSFHRMPHQQASGVLQPMGENEPSPPVVEPGVAVLEPSGSISSNSSSGRFSSSHSEQFVTMAGSREPQLFSAQASQDTATTLPDWTSPPELSPRGTVSAPQGSFMPSASGSLTPYFSPVGHKIPESDAELDAPSLQGCRQPAFSAESPSEEELSNAHFYLPQSVLCTVAASLQADVTIAAFLVRRVAETVLCEPRGLITLPVRMSKALLAASHGKVVDTEGLLLPSILTAALGTRPKRYLGATFSAEGYEGLCYALWTDPSRVPPQAEALLSDAARALPYLLANRVRALCGERMGRRFDAILTRMPQAVIFLEDAPGDEPGGTPGRGERDRVGDAGGGVGPCLINPAAADLLELSQAGEVDPEQVAMAMKELAERSPNKEEIFGWFQMLLESPQESLEGTWELRDPRCILKMWTFPINGQLTHGRVWLFDDVTAEHDVRSAVEEADRAKSNFLAMMSHQLRTPMTGVLGVLDLLRLTPLSAEQSGFVRVMQSSAEGLLHVLNEILDFSKIESGHLKLEETDFSIDELVEQVSALFQARLQERKLSLAVELPSSEDLPARGDPIRLQQVLNNLLSNAIKFTESGSIHISWRTISAPPQNSEALPQCHKPSANQSPASHITADLARSLSGTSVPPSRGASLSARLADALASKDPPAPENSSADPPEPSGPDASCTPTAQSQETCADKDTQDWRDSTGCGTGDGAEDGTVWYEVRVRDTGIGLNAEQQRRLFKSFSQADSSTTRRFGGSGLGLAVCKGLVNAMGGEIWVESKESVGSTFAFNLPLRRALLPPERLPEEEGGQWRGSGSGSGSGAGLTPVLASGEDILSVLVAEDNLVNQMLIKKMLRHYGHKVHLVANGQLAVEAVRERSWDMVLMDIQMPVMDGLEATMAIRALPPPACATPIYALTADVLIKASGTLEEMGLDGYLTKPINWDSLYGVIQKVVASREGREEEGIEEGERVGEG